MSFFRVQIEVRGETTAIDYESLDSCLADYGLRVLFDEGFVSECEVWCQGKRITALPFCTWNRFKENLISNSPTILKGLCQED
jgi:hypothetical protein